MKRENLSLMKQKSDIKKIIESRILFFDIAAKDAKVKLASCFGKNIPRDVEFDPHTISQVLNNLISNAIKFTKENGNVTVQALFHKKGESLEKEAKDSGINWFIKKDIIRYSRFISWLRLQITALAYRQTK